MSINLIHGDCLVEMQNIPDKSIDAIICDLPYGTTSLKWDSVIPFEPLWAQYKRIIKDNGAIVLFGSQPFTSSLVMSNPKWFKYEWIWEKEQGVNFQLAKKQCLKVHEEICVFCNGAAHYNPQDLVKCSKLKSNKGKGGNLGHQSSEGLRKSYVQQFENYPKSILRFVRERGLHPTQKPVALLEYLIKTYTNEGETVLDNCMGSGTTGVACKNIKRNFIGIELDDHYFEVASERINKTMQYV